MNISELTKQQAHFTYDIQRIADLRKGCGKTGIIGQPRALSALRMGMNVNTKGYNIYISGEDGTGRHSAVRQIASGMTGRPAYDLVYLYNFRKPQSPFLVSLKSPGGLLLSRGLEEAAAFAGSEQWEQAENAIEALTKRISPYSTPLLDNCMMLFGKALRKHEGPSEKYMANLVCDNSKLKSCPLVEEYHPTHANLFGQLSGNTDFVHLNLTSGSVLEAAGGFFTVSAEKVISRPELWESLKLFAESSSFLVKNENSKNSEFIRPVSDILNVKLILIGSDSLYDKLCESDDEFLRLFKVSAEFDFSMPSNDENIRGVISYLEETISRNNLKNITDDAVCELLVYSSWYAEMREELTARLSFLGDLLFEADYIASRDGKAEIDGPCVITAMEERDFANGLTEDRINREIQDGEMIISLEGTKTGVVNGLAVMDRGLASFGTPTVISVSVAPGSEGIVNIEHEAGLSGEIHDKGLLILEGYLRKQYARTFPLSIYAGICFEQSYAEVDGDSASSSELFALLSAIGELPVRQDIAITGSVNQLGDIQPVGGINEKISGFFAICERMGLTGRQGVIIPRQNIRTLILPRRVLKAIEEGRFHIYPITTIDEGMEILTWRPSGKRNVKGNFPPDTVNRVIEDRLKKLYELSKPAG